MRSAGGVCQDTDQGATYFLTAPPRGATITRSNMYLDTDTLVLSPTDLHGFVECRHLTELDRAVLRGELEKPEGRDPVADLLARKGDEHEREYLERLRAEGKSIIELPAPRRSIAELEEAAADTLQALREGPDVVYQATFLGTGPEGADGTPTRYRGHADFLFRVEGRPSELGDYSYEVADTKLARRSKPYFILQLCFYSECFTRRRAAMRPSGST